MADRESSFLANKGNPQSKKKKRRKKKRAKKKQHRREEASSENQFNKQNKGYKRSKSKHRIKRGQGYLGEGDFSEQEEERAPVFKTGEQEAAKKGSSATEDKKKQLIKTKPKRTVI